MSETIYHRYRLKRRTTAGWAANNEVLLAGEPGIEVLVDGTEKIKYGDGVKTWAQLSYAAGVGGGASLSSATPQALGTAAAGTSAEASRADHRHAMPNAGQVGADASGTAAAAVAAHAAAADPHLGYALESDARFSDARTPTAHKSTHATGGTDALSPADIGAATAAQGAKADSAVQPAGLTKAAVGLGNADNTSDDDKPVSTATATALAGKAGTGAIGSSGLTMATARLLGRTTAGAGAVEEIQVAGGTLANGVLTLSGLPSTLTADANGNLTFTARWIQSTNGATSAPPMALTGTWFTGGTSTTTKPQLLIEPAGTTSTTWRTEGTGLGVNAPSGFEGDLAWFGVGGSVKTRIRNNGDVNLEGALTSNLVFAGGGGYVIMNNVIKVNNIGSFQFTSTGNSFNAADLILTRGAPNTHAWRNGTNAQTGWLFNTYTNDSNYERLAHTWVSNVCYARPENAGTGSARLYVPVTGGTTVANLPAAATAGTGARSFVTDANATTFLSTVAGGGSNRVPVVSDGTNWLIA